MGRLHRAVTAVGAVVVIGVGSGPLAHAQTRVQPEGQTVHLLRGSITGTVTDDRGGPLAGVVVSALGVTMAMTVSDGRGYFAIDALPMGEYVVQAHLNGFAGSSRDRIRVGAASPSVHAFQLRKLDAAVGTTGVVAGRRSPDHGGGIRAPWIDPDGPARFDHGRRLQRSSAHRNRLAASPHQAQHPEGFVERPSVHRHRRRRRRRDAARLRALARD